MNIFLMRRVKLNPVIPVRLLLLMLLLFSCGTIQNNNSDPMEEVDEKGSYQLCVEVDEPDSEDNEALKEPLGTLVTVSTAPINHEKSIYRYEVKKTKFRFFCSPLSNWMFGNVALTRPYFSPQSFQNILQTRLRWVFHHKPDGADLLITSTWFLTDSNNSELKVIESLKFSEQVHRLRVLEQASFCLQDSLIASSQQEEVCNQILSEFNNKYSEYKEQVLQDARSMQEINTE